MFLKDLEIINWQCITKTSVKYDHLTIFIGPSNQGKSSVMEAIMFFLNYRNFRPKDVNNESLPLEIMGIFSELSVKVTEEFRDYIIDETLSIKVIRNVTGEFSYKSFNTKRKWVDITEKEYRNIVSNIDVLFIPSISEEEQSKHFIKSLIKILTESDYNVDMIIEHVNEMYNLFVKRYVSKGIYRKLVFEIFKEIIEYSRKFGKSLLNNTVLFFEEPELYLHPQASKELYDIFLKLTKIGTQIFISTHSSYFLSLKHYKSIAIVRNNGNGSTVFQYRGNLFSGDDVKSFNMNYWINPDRSELFFADKVILVEGQTDKIVIGYLAEKIKVFNYRYSVIECGSKSIIPQFIRLLNAFHIPYTVVYDSDNHRWRTYEERLNSNKKNKAMRKIINPRIGTYVELENDMEEEIYNEERERKNYKNKPFNALKAVMEDDYKLPLKLKLKIMKIYE
ncbi:ATP-dependent nuclease [Fusobacterium sp. PH5-44]|uniref:ATP-dependent nuclease n=1 Tax=unclassified Fusobacterium TaxID=2648384 RepID=UPI003D24C84F